MVDIFMLVKLNGVNHECRIVMALKLASSQTIPRRSPDTPGKVGT